MTPTPAGSLKAAIEEHVAEIFNDELEWPPMRGENIGATKLYAIQKEDVEAVLAENERLKSENEGLARSVMLDQTAHDLPVIKSGKPLWKLIMEANERFLKESEVD